MTSSPYAIADFILDELPDNCFDTVVSGDQIIHGKPDPQPYLMALSRLGVTAGNCLTFENSSNGASSAYRAGCRVVLVDDHGKNVQSHQNATSLDGLALADLIP